MGKVQLIVAMVRASVAKLLGEQCTNHVYNFISQNRQCRKNGEKRKIRVFDAESPLRM